MWGEIFNRNLLLAFVESIISFDIAKLLTKDVQPNASKPKSVLSSPPENNAWSFFSITGFIFFWVATVATKFMINATFTPKDANGPVTDIAAATNFTLVFQRLQFADQSQLVQLYFWLFIIFSASFLILKPLVDKNTIIIFIEASAMIAFISMILIIIFISIINSNPFNYFLPSSIKNVRDFVIPVTWANSFIYCFLVAFILGVISIYKNNDVIDTPRLSFGDIVKWLFSVFTVILIGSVIMFVSISMKLEYAAST
jgi:hypothetical protein